MIAVAGARRRRCDFGGGSDDATNEHRDARKSRDERGDVQVARASRGCPSSDGGVVVRCSRSAQPRQAGALRGTKLLRRLDQDQQILWIDEIGKCDAHDILVTEAKRQFWLIIINSSVR